MARPRQQGRAGAIRFHRTPDRRRCFAVASWRCARLGENPIGGIDQCRTFHYLSWRVRFQLQDPAKPVHDRMRGMTARGDLRGPDQLSRAMSTAAARRCHGDRRDKKADGGEGRPAGPRERDRRDQTAVAGSTTSLPRLSSTTGATFHRPRPSRGCHGSRPGIRVVPPPGRNRVAWTRFVVVSPCPQKPNTPGRATARRLDYQRQRRNHAVRTLSSVDSARSDRRRSPPLYRFRCPITGESFVTVKPIRCATGRSSRPPGPSPSTSSRRASPGITA